MVFCYEGTTWCIMIPFYLVKLYASYKSHMDYKSPYHTLIYPSCQTLLYVSFTINTVIMFSLFIFIFFHGKATESDCICHSTLTLNDASTLAGNYTVRITNDGGQTEHAFTVFSKCNSINLNINTHLNAVVNY